MTVSRRVVPFVLLVAAALGILAGLRIWEALGGG